MWKVVFPVRVRNIFLRGLVTGLFNVVVVTIPTLVVLAFILHGESRAIPGRHYCFLKGGFAVLICLFTFPVAYFSAIVRDTFPADGTHETFLPVVVDR
jgi:hypothetical protein